MDPLVGRALGPYELQVRLGAGGMGTVYRAVHRRLRQQRAVKVLPNNLAADPTFVQRFEREARLAAELRHPNIVVVHDVDDADGVYYIAMELLEGQSLRDLIHDEAPIPIERALNLLEPLAQALDFAHARNVVHRDVKPGNVFVGAGDHVTLVDFGIARAADGTVLTGSGIMGTPEYMAPEMLRGEGSGQTTDLYALGVVAFELFTGRLPFTGTNTPSIMFAQVHNAPPPLRSLQPTLPQALEDVVTRQLSKQPTERYSSAGAFVYALRAASGAGRGSAVDLDAPVLAGIAATLASGDWRSALLEFERLSQPGAPSALELRRQAEALRQREQPPTPQPSPTPAPIPSPSSWPPPPPVDRSRDQTAALSGPVAPAAGPDRRLLLVIGGLVAAVLLLGGLYAGIVMRPGSEAGQAAGQATPPPGTAKPGTTPNAEQTRIAEQTRSPAVATAAAAATNSAAASIPPPTSGAAGTAVPVPPKPTAAGPTTVPAATSTTPGPYQTRIGYLAAQSGGVQAERGRAMLTVFSQSLLAQTNKAGAPSIEQFYGFVGDLTGSAAGAQAAARKLIEQDKVSIVVGLSSGAETMAAAPIFQQAGIPFLSAFIDTSELAAIGNFIFPAPQGSGRQTPANIMPIIAERVHQAVKKVGEGGPEKMNDPKALREALREALAQPAPPPFPAGR